MTPAEPLLDPAVLARLERLQLGTRRRLAGHLSGEHRSVRHGSSLDFADYRDYVPGDDFRRIDYQLWARLDVLLVKLFDAEDDLVLRVVLDTSASMRGAKLQLARQVAAVLGFVALVGRDSVTLHTFPFEARAPRFAGRGAAPHLFAQLQQLEATGPTAFLDAVGALLRRPGPPGLTVVISDLLTPDWEAGLTRIPSRGGDLAVVHVLDRDELEPELYGDLDLVDSESGEVVAVSLSAEARRDYAAAVRGWLDEVAGRVRRAGGAYVRLSTGDDVAHAVLEGWRREGLLR